MVSEPRDVLSAVEDVRNAVENLVGGEALHVVQDRVEHALTEVELAYSTDTHDWVPVPGGTLMYRSQPFRFCAVCEREEMMDGTLLRKGVRPCTFERRPPGDPLRAG